MNVLLVGLGRWGERHLRVLRELGVTVWAADLSLPRLEWAIAHGVEPAHAVADYRKALAHVDAVDVVTPADSHLEIGEAALGAGRHCFIEKPLALSAADGRVLARAAAIAGRIVQVGHIFRFHPVTAALRQALAHGRIGDLRYATGRFSGFKQPRTDVGVTQTDALHYFDLFADLLGRPATAVMAVQRDFLGRGLDDLSVTIVDYGDIPVIVEADYFRPGTHRDCVIVGTRGSLVAEYASGVVSLHAGEHRRRGGAWEATDAGKEELAVEPAEPLRLELSVFVAACRGQAPPVVPAEAGIRALEIVEAAGRAAHEGRRVRLGGEAT